MAGPETEETEKEFDPSQRRLDQAREQGDVPRSEDLQAAVSYGGFLLAGLLLGPWAIQRMGTAGMAMLGGPDASRPGGAGWWHRWPGRQGPWRARRC
ncbi:EscU/YscU/HrcU family type III secretion system export apparatus switch protein [Fuscovulum blasticum]|uniref:EscU/YscU/HrcU family type III secretion system export apparatus switch protein n=1 Tax=Fuscovulum blasticum TaxID=1075 RepID=UPI00202AD674|nr:EscU/YscU/HrcU family type III secretion system export apparatus switch protein [Fuscovulum blasticum]